MPSEPLPSAARSSPSPPPSCLLFCWPSEAAKEGAGADAFIATAAAAAAAAATAAAAAATLLVSLASLSPLSAAAKSESVEGCQSLHLEERKARAPRSSVAGAVVAAAGADTRVGVVSLLPLEKVVVVERRSAWREGMGAMVGSSALAAAA